MIRTRNRLFIKALCTVWLRAISWLNGLMCCRYMFGLCPNASFDIKSFGINPFDFYYVSSKLYMQYGTKAKMEFRFSSLFVP